MAEPLFWLGFSILLVAIALTAVLVTLIPAVQELARAARSAEKLFDTLNRELPPTLESIRLTGMEITDLTDEVSQGVEGANRVVQQVDQSLLGVKQQAKRAQRVTRGFVAGFQAAWSNLAESPKNNRRDTGGGRDRETKRLGSGAAPLSDWETEYEADLLPLPSTQADPDWQYEDNSYDEYDEAADELETNSRPVEDLRGIPADPPSPRVSGPETTARNRRFKGNTDL